MTVVFAGPAGDHDKRQRINIQTPRFARIYLMKAYRDDMEIVMIILLLPDRKDD